MNQTIRTVFEVVKLQGQKTCLCAGGCGKRLKRQRTFEQTLNPWNAKENGVVKTRVDIMEELAVERDNWVQEPEKCVLCGNA